MMTSSVFARVSFVAVVQLNWRAGKGARPRTFQGRRRGGRRGIRIRGRLNVSNRRRGRRWGRRWGGRRSRGRLCVINGRGRGRRRGRGRGRRIWSWLHINRRGSRNWGIGGSHAGRGSRVINRLVLIPTSENCQSVVVVRLRVGVKVKIGVQLDDSASVPLNLSVHCSASRNRDRKLADTSGDIEGLGRRRASR